MKQSWGEDKLKKVNALLDTRFKSDTSTDDEGPSASSTTASSSAAAKKKGKPKLSKTRTMKNTTKVCWNKWFKIYLIILILKEAKTLLGKQVLGDTRAETKRRQAAVKAKKTLQEVTKPTSGRKTGLKRLGTIGNTARVNISLIIFLYVF